MSTTPKAHPPLDDAVLAKLTAMISAWERSDRLPSDLAREMMAYFKKISISSIENDVT